MILCGFAVDRAAALPYDAVGSLPLQKTLPKLILASESPRRKLLLSGLGLEFATVAPLGEEAILNVGNVSTGVRENALAKARSVLESSREHDSIFIGADTVVSVEGKVLGKPKNVTEAREMLLLQSQKTQVVYTGLALISKKFGERIAVEESKVTFRKIAESELTEYLSTKEPYDKAGAYAVQGVGALFIDKIDGSYSNVMGFPIELFLKELALLTKVSVFEWFK